MHTEHAIALGSVPVFLDLLYFFKILDFSSIFRSTNHSFLMFFDFLIKMHKDESPRPVFWNSDNAISFIG